MIKIFDTTLRDGEQAPGYSMNLQEKLEMARQLERLGVDIIEAGFPVASPDDFEAVREIAGRVEHATVAGLCRAVKKDIDRTWEAVREARHPRIHIVLATSDLHLEYKLNATRAQVLATAEEMVAYAKTLCEDVEFSAEDAMRSDPAYLAEVFTAVIRAGATTVSVPDTVGYAVPEEITAMFRYLKAHVPGIEEVCLSVHCHNDLGLAVANSLAAVEAGAGQVECTVNGIGERAGNAALEAVVMAIATRKDKLDAETAIKTVEISSASKLLSTITGVAVPPNQPIVGQNAFAHEAGIHQHGMMKNPLTYQILSPESVGIRRQSSMVLGKHSGRHAFEEYLTELGYTLAPDRMNEAFERFKLLADRKKTITDRDIDALMRTRALEFPETYELLTFVVNSGSNISATACVKVRRGEEILERVAFGEGPVDAAFKAIDKIVKLGITLVSFDIHAVTEGEDALGQVTVKLQFPDGEVVTGRGLTPDIFESSIKAYLAAINKYLAEKPEEALGGASWRSGKS